MLLLNIYQVLNYYDTVLNYEEYRITSENDTSFFSLFNIDEEAENYSIICYVSNTTSGMYGIALRAPDGNSLMKRRIFFDILEGCYIKNERVYDPFVYSKIEKL